MPKTWINDQSEAEKKLSFCEAVCLLGSINYMKHFAKKTKTKNEKPHNEKANGFAYHETLFQPLLGQEKGDEGARWLRKGMQNGLGPVFPSDSLSLTFLLRFPGGDSFWTQILVCMTTNSRDFDLGTCGRVTL